MTLKNWSGGVHLLCLIIFVGACGTGGPISGSGSTTGSTVLTSDVPSAAATHETTVPPTAESTAPSTSLSGAVPTAPGSAATPNVLSAFVETWNLVAVNQGREEWVIGPWLPLRPPSSPENTYGLEVSLGEPTQLIVDAGATGDLLSRLEVAVLRWDESSVELLEDAFRIGIMTAVATDDLSQVSDLVAELVEQAVQSPADQTDTVELPGDAIAGSFSTDQVYVLGVRWPSD